jgi:hypothetical protein
MIAGSEIGMTDTQSGPARDPDDDGGDRTLANIVLAVGFVVLVGGECIASGRRNCIPIDAPPR